MTTVFILIIMYFIIWVTLAFHGDVERLVVHVEFIIILSVALLWGHLQIRLYSF